MNKYADKAKTKDPELSAGKARRAAKEQGLRKDCLPEMLKICTKGWTWSEEKASRLNTDDIGYYIDETKTVIIEPEDASELYVHHNYEGNRSFDQSHSEHLSSAMKLAPQIAIAIGPDSYPRIVNGQHTMWAINMRGRPTQASVTIYQCRDSEAIAALFSIFDSNKKRSVAQALDAAKFGKTVSVDIPSSRLQRWSQCIASANNKFNSPKSRETLSSRVERATCDESVQFAQWMEQLVTKAEHARFIHQGVGAAFYAMYLSDRLKAEQFIRKYLSGVGITGDSDPIGKIRHRLVINKPPAEHGASACGLHAGIVYTAWRKFCLDQPLTRMTRITSLPPPEKWKVFASAADVESEELVA